MKKKIILISIVSGLLILLALLFGVVFCLYNQTVEVVGENLNVSNEKIVEYANLKQGQSIFALDKEKAISNIEEKEPYIKVIQIKTVNLNSIKIVVRKRVETYYCQVNDNFYYFDEELKVLKISTETPVGLIKVDNDLLELENKQVCDFVSGKLSKSLAYNAFVALMSVCQEDVDGQAEYYSREQVCDFIENISIEKGYTLDCPYNRLVLTTSYGVKFDIGKPEDDLTNKMNMCFSAMQNLDEEKKISGRIKISYLENGEQHFGWLADWF